MATFILTDVDVFTNGYEFSSQINSVQVAVEADPVDVTDFASGGWREHLGGIKKAMIDYSGFASHGSSEISTILRHDGTLGDGGTLVSLSPSNTENEPAFTMNALQSSVSHLGAVGEAEPIAASFANGSNGGYGMLAGRLIATNASRTSSTTSTGYQYGALAAGQSMYSALHVTAASGTSPTLDDSMQS